MVRVAPWFKFRERGMRTSIGCVAMLLSAMGIVTDAAAVSESNADAAGKRGLSPIISTSPKEK